MFLKEINYAHQIHKKLIQSIAVIEFDLTAPISPVFSVHVGFFCE